MSIIFLHDSFCQPPMNYIHVGPWSRGSERLHNRYTALQLAHVCTYVTGRQHVKCTGSLISACGALRSLV